MFLWPFWELINNFEQWLTWTRASLRSNRIASSSRVKTLLKRKLENLELVYMFYYYANLLWILRFFKRPLQLMKLISCECRSRSAGRKFSTNCHFESVLSECFSTNVYLLIFLGRVMSLESWSPESMSPIIGRSSSLSTSTPTSSLESILIEFSWSENNWDDEISVQK